MKTKDVTEKPSAPAASTPRTGSVATIELQEIIATMLAEIKSERSKQSKKLRYNIGFYDGEEFALNRLKNIVYPKPPNDEASEPGTMTHDNPKPEAANPRRNPGSLR